MVDDEHDDGVQSAAGVVMDAPLEWFKVEDDVQYQCWWQRRRASVAVPSSCSGGNGGCVGQRASRRFRHHLSRSVGGSGGDSLGVRASAPPPPLYSAGATGAHNPIGLGSPDQGAESRAQLGRWTESVEINTNILSLDLTFIL